MQDRTMTLLFPQPAYPVLDCNGGGYPLRRIFCVGRNYAAHAAEMGHAVDREAPFYFMKDASSYVPSGSVLPFPPQTQDLHHEVELVVALGADLFEASPEEAKAAIWGYGVGLDMTRRDLQQQAKDKRRSWDPGKNFEQSAIISPLIRAEGLGELGPQRIHLEVDGAERQSALLSDMIWTVPEILVHLSRFYHLAPGDIIMTGTPAGVGPVTPGSHLTGGIEGIGEIELTYL